MEKNYRCSKTKEEIIATIVEHFFIANEAYEEVKDDTHFGAYSGLRHLMQDLEIYDVEGGK